MTDTQEMADRFVALLGRVLRQHPKLVFPDERLRNLKRQLRNLRPRSLENPGDRMFLFRALAMLQSRAEPPTMGELSAELGVPLSSATRMADHLVRAKFVERRADANDRRIVRLCLTGSGRKFIEVGVGLLRQRVGHVLSRFTAEEQAQLLRLAGKLIESLEAEA